MDVAASTIKNLRRSFEVFQKDLMALPPEAFDHHFGGKARTVADIVHEVNLVNESILSSMLGEPGMEWPEGWIYAPENLREKDAAIAAFEAVTAKVMAAAEAFTEEDMAQPITTEHGETNRFERCRFIALHNFYHSGQLNFIQTMLGDDGWHW